ARLSTVYMPGYKITMLPEEVVDAYTLGEGAPVPAVSLYVTLDEATLEIQDRQTRLERVPIAANLRHDQLDALITADWLQGAAAEGQIDAQRLPVEREQLSFLYKLSQHLKARREVVRGKPETFTRPDYSFRLVGNDGAVPTGAEQVRITTRARGAPLDLIVSELMILANSSWGEWLKSLGVPAIYRSQASLLPGIKVRMGARALPHAGLGVPSYAWSTSPLRRYVDLVNQWQIIAAARHGTAAALAAPFKPKDAALLAIISGFDAAYSAYGAHQAGMERFWTLRYLRQEGIGELSASLLREQGGGAWLVRADTLPLVFTVMGAQGLPRGTRVRVRLGQIDDIALDVHGTVIEVLDAAAASPEPADEEDENAAAGPIAIAVDLDEADSASKDNPAS
ncbi:MAG TPA: RNB domain-containing ribonuclease, partial [Ottowia sp.]|nr:RNB domain-containing ribonuclease [Ottowia sp.]